jgi:membrane protein involved in colicin uptake
MAEAKKHVEHPNIAKNKAKRIARDKAAVEANKSKKGDRPKNFEDHRAELRQARKTAKVMDIKASLTISSRAPALLGRSFWNKAIYTPPVDSRRSDG